MRKYSVGIVAVTLVSGCVFQVGPEALAERTARANPAPAVDEPVAPADDDLVAPPEEEAPPPDPLPPWDFSTRFEGLRDGRIVGNIGPALDLDLPTDLAEVYDDGYFAQVTVYAVRNDGRRVMLQLQVDNLGEPFFVPGVGKRMRPGPTSNGGYVGALACEGADSGDADEPFEDTPFDDEPCDVGVDTEQNPDDPTTLRVTLQATFADGDCPDDGGIDDGGDVPDVDGDGDGDLPDGSDPVGPGDTVNPLSATTTFTLTP